MGRGGVFLRAERAPRRRGAVALAAVASGVALAACGTGSPAHFKNDARPPVPVDLSVYMDNNHVSISPAKLGAGPVILYVTNQASGTQTLTIRNAHGGSVASSGHINSGATAQVTANLKTGTYKIAGGAKASAAQLKITKSRPNADNVLLQP